MVNFLQVNYLSLPNYYQKSSSKGTLSNYLINYLPCNLSFSNFLFMKKYLLATGMLFSAFLIQAQTRIPLFEIFTSSTCPPCNPGNKVYEGIVDPKPASDYVSVKFQQDFPGTGDPYCTAEGVSRRNYYGINSIPRMEINGGWDQNAQSFTQVLYDSSKLAPAKYSLTGTFDVTNKVVTVNVKYAPLTHIGVSHKLYVAIVEKHTQNNVKSNGEVYFFNVMKKMMPNYAGTTLGTFNVGDQDSLSFTFAFQGSYRLPIDGQSANHIKDISENSVEYFENLKVVAWIQGSDKEVYNAANLVNLSPKADPNPLPLAVHTISASVQTVQVSPNPASNNLHVNVNMIRNDAVTVTLTNLAGAVVATQVANLSPGTHDIIFDTQNLPSGFYNLVLTDAHKDAYGEKISIMH